MYRTAVTVTTSALLLALTACGSTDTSAEHEDTVTVTTSFYPLQYATEQVGGEHVQVSNLTQPGAEPHDLELSPKQVLQASRADHLIYLSGFQPSVDDAVTQTQETAFDVSESARLDIAADEHEGHDHGEGSHGHDHGARDPHFWLDPTRYADVADAIAELLAEDDPAHAEDYRANATAFTAELTDLDQELEQDLSVCSQRDLVTGHAAFAYFADRYDFHQVSVSGLSPDAQPSSAAIAELISHIRAEDISTVYAEPLVPRDLADTIARDSGATVAVLDPIEGVTQESAGSDYFEIMRSNRDAVREGQGCR
ncbi:metal ABC transporter substrate-binding protein [Janibacter cremeus]|uniref:Zinc transport system substrate-binding protein n=1 Tax=Janibacter cremeus TaxID=1285192 RepID=A0A852VVK0_9MICO|nr:metal ABC transporter substrate-binding protein [Janibacter cremeus]NYF99430.1 zinc transport system substrate-binding protein [Janibacter cremeus]